MSLNTFKLFIYNEERLQLLTELLKRVNIESVLNDYYKLPDGFTIHIVDQQYLENQGRDFHKFIRSTCWIYITNDQKSTQVSDVSKMAIHHIHLEELTQSIEKELLIVLEKCINVKRQFDRQIENHFIQIQKPDKTYKVIKSDQVYLFTNIDRNTYMFYQSDQGQLKKEVIHNSLSFLENKLRDHRFFRTHKNYLVNVNQLNKSQPMDSHEVSLGHNLTAKLSRLKQNDLIHYLESM